MNLPLLADFKDHNRQVYVYTAHKSFLSFELVDDIKSAADLIYALRVREKNKQYYKELYE